MIILILYLNCRKKFLPGAPVLCAGCPHRAMYYGVNKALEELGIPLKDAVFASDIGCYTFRN